jgi:anti-sigma regulatory factor (Ser/Thr protein kinase)
MNVHHHTNVNGWHGRVLHVGDTFGATGPQALPDGVELTLAATAEAPAQARRAAREALAHWDPERRDAALLVISELVTNAVRHGSEGPRDAVAVRVQRHGGATRIEVTDDNAGQGEIVAAPGRGDQRSGWGLPIVAELTDRWGVEHHGSCTCVWCELDAV